MATQTAEIVIIGGGVMGTALAHALVRGGMRRVLLIERFQVGAGSTGRSVANCVPLTRHAPTAQAYRQSLAVWQHFEQVTGQASGWEPLPFVALADASKQPTLTQAFDVLSAQGVDVAWMAAGDFADHERDFVPYDAALPLLYSTDSGFVNPEWVTYAYLEAAKQQRLALWEGVEVRSVVLGTGGAAHRLVTANGDVETPRVVFASGGWTQRLLNPLGLTGYFRDHEQVVGVFDVPPNKPPMNHLVADLSAQLVYRYAMSNRYVFVPLTLHKDATESAMNIDPSIYISLMSDMREGIVARFSDLSRSVLQPGWSGVWNLSADGLPVVGETALEGLYLAAGLGNVGMGLVPALADALAAQILGLPISWDFGAFSPLRFANPAYQKSEIQVDYGLIL